jgi:hypothetical protein
MIMGHYHYNFDEYCEQYDGSQDTPAHCCACGAPLDYTLTEEGVAYVIDALVDELIDGIDEHIIPLKGTAEERLTYYHGSPHYVITMEWAEHLLDNTVGRVPLDRKDAFIVDHYLEVCSGLTVPSA